MASGVSPQRRRGDRREPSSRSRERSAPSTGSRADGLEALQNALGNRGVAALLHQRANGSPTHSTGGEPILREPDPEAGGDGFNPHSIVNDLRRAIDQADKTISGMKPKTMEYTFHRKVDFDKVYAVLDSLTGTQIGMVRRLYKDAEGTTLDNDLFERGQSDTPSSITPQQKSRLSVLLRGTKGDALPPEVARWVTLFKPHLAARVQQALQNTTLPPDALNRLERTALELAELLTHDLNAERIERVMAVHRRPVAETVLIDLFYEEHAGTELGPELFGKLSDQRQRARLFALREGNATLADAHAVEIKRSAIAELDAKRNARDDSDKVLEAAAKHAGGVDADKAYESTRKKLVADIDEVVARNRGEAIAGAEGTSKTASQAVAERMQAVFSIGRDDQGRDLGALVKQTLGATKGAELSALINGGLVEAHAHHLAEIEQRGKAKPADFIGVIGELRAEAERDLIARASDPWLGVDERKRLVANKDTLVSQAAAAAVEQLKVAYDAARGTGRSWEIAVADFSSGDEDEVNRLARGGGKMTDEEELDLAIRRGKPDLAIAVLKRQPNREAVEELEKRYKSRTDKDLQRQLFGSSKFEDRAATSFEASREVRSYIVSGGIMKGRNASLAVEQLAKPRADADETTRVGWIISSAEREYEATLENQGLTGAAREWGDDPETQVIMRESIEKIRALSERWIDEPDPKKRKPLVAEMRKWRATLTGDAKAYEEDNKRMLDTIRSVLTFAVQIALAVALPGAGATLVSFMRITAMQIAASIATDVVIYGEDYSLDQLKGSIVGGVMGAAGGKFAEELVGAAIVARAAAKGEQIIASKIAGEVADAIAAPIAKETATAATKVGIKTTIAKEVANQVGSNVAVTFATGTNQFTAENILQGNIVSFAGRFGKKVLGLEPMPDTVGGKKRTDEGGAPRPDEATRPTNEEAPTPKGEPEPTTAKKGHDDLTAVPAVHPGSVVAGSHGEGGGRRPPPGPVDPASSGIPPASQRSIQQLADQRNIIIKARPVNLDSIPHLERGALAKPEIVKSKTLKPIDELIGGPKGREGLVGFFEPHPPSDALPADVHQAAMERYQQRKADYEQHLAEYQKLEAEGILRRNNGVLELADVRTGTTEGSFKPVSGDLDIYDIVHADGSPLTADQRTAIINELRFMGVNVDHGAHEWWRAQSPETFDPKIDADIRAQHMENEPLVAFVPLTPPQGVWADTPVTGPARTEGHGDRHQPLANAQEAAPGGPGAPGAGGHGPGGGGRGGGGGNGGAGDPARRADLVARIEQSLAHLNTAPTADGLAANVVLDRLRSNAGRGRNAEALHAVERALDVLQERALFADVLADLVLGAEALQGPAANRLAQQAFETSRAGGNEPVVLTGPRLQAEAAGQFVEWVMQNGPFYDFDINTETHGRMAHLIQDLVIDRYHGMNATELRGLLRDIDAPNVPGIHSQVWTLLFDPLEGAGAISPEDLTAALRTVVELAELR